MVRQRRWDDADQVYRRALTLYLKQDLDQEMIHLLMWPQVVALAIDAADFAMQMGDRTHAADILQRVLVQDPGNTDVNAALESLK